MANTDNKINIGDSFKSIDSIQINIGDSWKTISEGYINIGDVWKKFWSSTSTAGRGVMIGGGGGLNTIDYITIATAGNATDFGDMLAANGIINGATSNGTNQRGVHWGDSTYEICYITINSTGNSTDFGDYNSYRSNACYTSNGTNERAIYAGGLAVYPTPLNIIEYITINSTGDGTDFGDLTIARWGTTGVANATNERAIYGGGDTNGSSPQNFIDYVTINSANDATDFGDLSVTNEYMGKSSNGTNERALFYGRWTGSVSNIIDYLTINSTGNATDFGDLTVSRGILSGTDNKTSERGVATGGTTSSASNVIDYVTINSTGNATDFGDLTVARNSNGATSNA